MGQVDVAAFQDLFWIWHLSSTTGGTALPELADVISRLTSIFGGRLILVQCPKKNHEFVGLVYRFIPLVQERLAQFGSIRGGFSLISP